MAFLNLKFLVVVVVLLLIIAGAVVGLRQHQVSADRQAASMLSDPNKVHLDSGNRY